ncbi:PREDICTED: cordon-bleu protein-like 1 [Tinamus guttatus]|uniref:cordon-bleu protein-like 1 n=1 Tax=Tinamus guttatus TaxID=94827 RepID=UPI00052F2DB2|nr:PREDICTED: cordon-bleu protein-like 1 [Tinamus guttatus]
MGHVKSHYTIVSCTAALDLVCSPLRKAKAPPPPPETKNVDVSPFDDTESANFTMEQKENVIDKDIELSVVLPGDVIKYTTVNGRKPMMDLLIFLCAQYRLNPSSYTIELMSAENSQIKFKPNTPIGMLEVEKVIVKPKQMDKKKPAPVIPEQTVRVVINYKKTQKTVVRVSPHAPLQELIPIISSKCEFDPSHTVLLKNYQSQEALDVTKSLNDFGLRELYAMDISRATSPADLNLPSLQDSYQMSENLDVLKERENRGFFSFFQRSKKKREQAASAPATPLMSKPRPTFITRCNTVSKQYDSSTLPSEMPKKRRAPLPPMTTSQSAPQDLARAQVKTASDIVKSNSFDRNEQDAPGLGVVRKGSLPLSDTASVNSSLRRMKRKAPSPPSKMPEDQSESINEPVTPAKDTVEEKATEIQTETGIRSTECGLEGIDENEEMSVHHGAGTESTEPSLRTAEAPAALSSAELPLETEKNDPASSAPVPGSVSVDNTQSLKEEKQENISTDGKGLQTKISTEQVAFEKDRKLRILDENKNDDDHGTKLLATTEEEKELQATEITAVDFRENKLEVDRLSSCQACKNDISVSHRNYPQVIPEIQEQKSNRNSLDTVKTQDVAIQTGPSEGNLERTTVKEITVPQEPESFRGLARQHNTDTNNPRLQLKHGVQEDEEISAELNLQREGEGNPIKDQSHSSVNGDNVASPEATAKIPDGSPLKSYPLYRQDTKPKPKPSNEITRDYIPKIGMTTYKIVPPKSLEVMKSLESEIPSDYKDQQVSALENSLNHEDSKELMQTEIPQLQESVDHLQVGSQNEHTAANGSLHRVNSVSEHAGTSQLEIAPKSNPVETEFSKQRVPLALSLDNANASSETQDKSNALSPAMKPSSFFLQMQRRASAHYVTSAVAKSTVSVPNTIQNEAKSTDIEKRKLSPDQTTFLLHKASSFSPSADEQKDDDENKIVSSNSPVKSKPLSFPSCQPASLSLKTLRTFAAPKPYSSSRPSPFALAVSSAVRRSQHGSRELVSAQSLCLCVPLQRSLSSRAAAEQPGQGQAGVAARALAGAQAAGAGAGRGFPRPPTRCRQEPPRSEAAAPRPRADPPEPPGCHSLRRSCCQVEKARRTRSERTSSDCQYGQSVDAALAAWLSFVLCKGRQLLVGPPPNAMSVNGRARLTPLYSTEAKTNH